MKPMTLPMWYCCCCCYYCFLRLLQRPLSSTDGNLCRPQRLPMVADSWTIVCCIELRALRAVFLSIRDAPIKRKEKETHEFICLVFLKGHGGGGWIQLRSCPAKPPKFNISFTRIQQEKKETVKWVQYPKLREISFFLQWMRKKGHRLLCFASLSLFFTTVEMLSKSLLLLLRLVCCQNEPVY